jgi:hypothetical protein
VLSGRFGDEKTHLSLPVIEPRFVVCSFRSLLSYPGSTSYWRVVSSDTPTVHTLNSTFSRHNSEMSSKLHSMNTGTCTTANQSKRYARVYVLRTRRIARPWHGNLVTRFVLMLMDFPSWLWRHHNKDVYCKW